MWLFNGKASVNNFQELFNNLKKSSVVPVHKKGDEILLQNYHQVPR